MIENLFNKIINYLVVNDEDTKINFNCVETLNKMIIQNIHKIKCDSFYLFKVNYKNIYYDSDINITTNCISSHIINDNLNNLINVSYHEDNIINQNLINIKNYNQFISTTRLKSKNLFLYQIFNQFHIKWIYNILLYDINGAIWGNVLFTWTHEINDKELVETEIKTIINYIHNYIKNS